MVFWRLTPKVPHRKLWQSGTARQASTGQSTRDEGSARWAAQKGPAGSAGRLSVQNSHSGCFEQGITLTVRLPESGTGKGRNYDKRAGTCWRSAQQATAGNCASSFRRCMLASDANIHRRKDDAQLPAVAEQCAKTSPPFCRRFEDFRSHFPATLLLIKSAFLVPRPFKIP